MEKGKTIFEEDAPPSPFTARQRTTALMATAKSRRRKCEMFSMEVRPEKLGDRSH